MKKWYVITGLLALLLLISIGTCSSNAEEVDSLRGDIDQLETELSSAKTELDGVKTELSSARTELDGVKAELNQLKATKEIGFGNGLKVFEVEKGWYEVHGKIENVSSAPMQKVVVLVAFYNKDGQLDSDWGSVGTDEIYDLYVGETAEWSVHFGNWSDEELGLFDVYAIGNR